ncbi:carboxymuconolactone decarboxylase family protein [Bacillus sp. FJAT-45350]|uniref:carboxymuconolactone decarboxylase family protein n=1 Tax=Bacillus sp. FJAT-45350 TaxID=2011014 RepID=UPI000BB990AA|nr:carboxymuconolactone decarboxylase family protein [Bacillus sp. FJAT-45350]
MGDKILYKMSYFNRIGELNEHATEAFQAFIKFDKDALKKGALSVKQKETIAVAVAHITGCPYCIDIHVNQFKDAGGTQEEMSEALFVATAMKAGSALAHGVNALNAFDADEDVLYKQQYFDRLKEFSTLNKDAFLAFIDFDKQTMKPGALTVKEKELIAVASAHATGCPYCIELHTKAAKTADATIQEISEAIMVATALKAGAALAHSVNALNAYCSCEDCSTC